MDKISDKLLSWASILEDGAREQSKLASQMPFITPYMALMPDAHLGRGATVGSVIPTMGAIMPAAVGVDIGCGMIAVKTQYNKDHLVGDSLGKLRHSIERSIPLSAGHDNRDITKTAQRRIDTLKEMASGIDYYKFAHRWEAQLGSLGSGNHFIEVCLDEDDNVWLFLHSGSRGVGNQIAMHHIKIAKDVMRRYFIELADQDLSYLVEGTSEFTEYIRDMMWAQQFALFNREEMMDRVIKDFQYWLGGDLEEQERINCHHNFTQQENHMGKNVWLTRKGAIKADEGTLGLIPGSMGTASYVVVGKGNVPSFKSAPHGAGRNFSRTHARKTFTMEQLEKAMEGKEWSHSKAFLDEIPGAYKDIDVVMKDAEDLVEIKHTLTQIVNIKGD